MLIEKEIKKIEMDDTILIIIFHTIIFCNQHFLMSIIDPPKRKEFLIHFLLTINIHDRSNVNDLIKSFSNDVHFRIHPHRLAGSGTS